MNNYKLLWLVWDIVAIVCISVFGYGIDKIEGALFGAGCAFIAVVMIRKHQDNKRRIQLLEQNQNVTYQARIIHNNTDNQDKTDSDPTLPDVLDSTHNPW